MCHPVFTHPTCKRPCPCAYWQWFLSGLAVLASARFTLNGEYGTACAFRPESSSATAPHVCGLAMEVPFISWLQRRVKCGTEVMAPPGAHTVTPRSPSIVGPRDVHV